MLAEQDQISSKYSIFGGGGAVCMVTDIAPDDPSNNFRVVHIMPRSTQRKFLDSIAMNLEDVDDIRNLLLLCTNIERAFDRICSTSQSFLWNILLAYKE